MLIYISSIFDGGDSMKIPYEILSLEEAIYLLETIGGYFDGDKGVIVLEED